MGTRKGQNGRFPDFPVATGIHTFSDETRRAMRAFLERGQELTRTALDEINEARRAHGISVS